ncbi:hypothetical protein BDW66DRAFT_142399 [Aspergillus desertorum]
MVVGCNFTFSHTYYFNPSLSTFIPCSCPLFTAAYSFLNLYSAFSHCTKSTFANAYSPSAPVAAALL